METRRIRDPRTFQAETESYLLGAEAKHNLMLGLLATLIDRPDVYPDFGLWVVEDAGHVVGAAFMTPPFNVILATPTVKGAVETLAAYAVPDAPWDDERARRNLKHKIPDGSGGGMRIWEDDGPVCLVGFVEATPRTARVGPVYTPPAMRGRGYATALTAHVSRGLLDQGRQQCLLYTDLANPTSNAIYHRIGYRVVCNSAMVAFEEDR